MKGLTWRISVVFAAVLFSVYLLIPSVIKFQTGKAVPRVAKESDPWYYSWIPSEVLRLGLDLRGGVHLVLGIDFAEVRKDSLIKLRGQIQESLSEEKVANVKATVAPDNQRIIIEYPNDTTWEKIDDVFSKYGYGRIIDFDSQTNTVATIRMSALQIREVEARAVDQSLETLRNRIDQFGIAEPIIQRHGEDKILVQFPGVREIGRLKEIISRTAKLSFNFVVSGPEEPNGPPPAPQLQTMVDEFLSKKNITLTEVRPISSYITDINKYLGKRLPEGSELLFSKKKDINTREDIYTPYLLEKSPIITGEELDDAYLGFNQDGDPIVNFALTPAAGSKFEKATGENIGRYMAIVLDNNVHSAPYIRTRIPGGRGIIEMGSASSRNPEEVRNDAKDTSLVLRSGALPAKLEFLEERVIGPSLGADAIRAGTISLAVGLAAVLTFMAIYYRGAGIVAVLALVLNGLFVLGSMAAFEGTLSLPGLAGLTLTLGMAVDANVLIFGYIREELRNGKRVNLAIAEGYGRAFSAIFDANITTIIAATVLLGFGYGPIRGFAVTLLIGIVCSMFTAIFITRVVFDYFIVSKGRQNISI